MVRCTEHKDQFHTLLNLKFQLGCVAVADVRQVCTRTQSCSQLASYEGHRSLQALSNRVRFYPLFVYQSEATLIGIRRVWAWRDRLALNTRQALTFTQCCRGHRDFSEPPTANKRTPETAVFSRSWNKEAIAFKSRALSSSEKS